MNHRTSSQPWSGHSGNIKTKKNCVSWKRYFTLGEISFGRNDFWEKGQLSLSVYLMYLKRSIIFCRAFTPSFHERDRLFSWPLCLFLQPQKKGQMIKESVTFSNRNWVLLFSMVGERYWKRGSSDSYMNDRGYGSSFPIILSLFLIILLTKDHVIIFSAVVIDSPPSNDLLFFFLLWSRCYFFHLSKNGETNLVITYPTKKNSHSRDSH